MLSMPTRDDLPPFRTLAGHAQQRCMQMWPTPAANTPVPKRLLAGLKVLNGGMGVSRLCDMLRCDQRGSGVTRLEPLHHLCTARASPCESLRNTRSNFHHLLSIPMPPCRRVYVTRPTRLCYNHHCSCQTRAWSFFERESHRSRETRGGGRHDLFRRSISLECSSKINHITATRSSCQFPHSGTQSPHARRIQIESLVQEPSAKPFAMH